VRTALGAARPRLLRQLVVESLVIGLLAGLVATGLALPGFGFLVGALPLGALAETATFELRASEVASPRPDDQLTLGGETFVVQGEPDRRDPDRLVWTLDTRPI
jgi:ABC-type antimicrobial peptide transport system permease subunit